MANLCTTLQALQQNILSDSDSETEQRRSRRYKGLLSAHSAHHRCRSSSSDGSRKSVDSVYIPRPRYRKQCVERDVASRPPLNKERRGASESRHANRQSPVQNQVTNVSNRNTSGQSSVCSDEIHEAGVYNVQNKRSRVVNERTNVHDEQTNMHSERMNVHDARSSVRSQQSSDDRHSVDEEVRTLGRSRPRGVGDSVDIPSAGQRRMCGSGRRDGSSEDSRRDSADDRMISDTCRDRGTSDESRKSPFDKVFIPKSNGCGPNCLSGPEYIRCRCCGRFKKPETYRNIDRQTENDSPLLRQSQKQHGDENIYSADSETNVIDDKPPPIPKRKPLKKTKPGTFQPTQILSNVSCESKPPKHITFREDTKENTNIDTNGCIPRLHKNQSLYGGASGTECRSTVVTSRPASALGAMRSRGALPVLPSYEDIVGARGFGFRKSNERSQSNRCNVNNERKNPTMPERPGLLWRSHSIDGIDRLRCIDSVPTNNAALSVSTDDLDMSSRKIIVEFLV